MVSVLASNVVDLGFEKWSGQNKDLVFAASLLSTYNKGLRVNTAGLGIKIKCPSEAARRSVNGCFSEVAL